MHALFPDEGGSKALPVDPPPPLTVPNPLHLTSGVIATMNALSTFNPPARGLIVAGAFALVVTVLEAAAPLLSPSNSQFDQDE